MIVSDNEELCLILLKKAELEERNWHIKRLKVVRSFSFSPETTRLGCCKAPFLSSFSSLSLFRPRTMVVLLDADLFSQQVARNLTRHIFNAF